MAGVCSRMSMIGIAILHADRHEQARHDRKMEGHVALVAVAEVGDGIFRPLVRLRQQHAVAEAFVDVLAQLLEEGMRLRQVLAVGAVTLVEVRYRVEPQAIDPKAQPEVHHLQHRLMHRGVVEVEVGLMRIEAVPVVGLGDRIPSPIRRLEVLEDDAGIAVLLRRVTPHVKVAPDTLGLARATPAETTGADPTCG